ncbi:MAG: PilZ domain-containing protein [Deltaproteobacteria bacterium]|nr:PilZ domain-containing protein [Deltaproteobacteria bacterium]
MADNSGQNRREFERVDARVRVKLKFDNVKNLRQFYTKDISQGGLFIVAEKPKPIGTRVEIVIYPPGVPLGFPLQGTVVHIVDAAAAKSRGTAPGMGIRFADLTPDKVASIKAYIDSMAEIEREETVAATPPPVTTTEQPKTAVPAPVEEDTRPVELRLNNRDQLKKLFVQDLAKGTLFLRTREVRPVGSAVSVHLIVEGMQKGVWLSATVVRVVMSAEKGKDMSGMGLELTDFSAEKRKAIDDYVKGRAADIDVAGAEQPSEPAASEAPESSPTTEAASPAEEAPPELEPEPLAEGASGSDAEAAVWPTPSAKGKPVLPSISELDKDKKDQRPALANVEQLESAVKEFENVAVSKNYFDQLGLPPNTLLDEIKTAYFQLVRRFHPDPWQGKVSPETLDRLQKVQMHLRTLYDTLTHPQKRATYEVSNGIEADGGDAILQQAREKKRSEYRAAFARKFGDHISKGEKLIDAAMEDIRAGKTKSALSNIRLALSFDPLNEKYRKLLKTVLDKGGKA